ncbi:hypothetical protein AAFC00_001296 [Neodothiora populina]|uniref:Dienelactone hydrolase domain-containing protein n=1 Tax=Neodothiora populina TaxID=2781224 RepID=A0ABR3PNE9_9PEZI
MSDCCKSGYKWDASPSGKETKLGSNNAYVTGSNPDAAIMIVHDVFGWTLPNVRVLADHYAKEANATVYIPDFFGGEVVDPDAMSDPEKKAKFDLMAFLGRNSKEKRFPEIKSCAQALKGQYKKVGAIGFCWGGWAVFQLGAKGNNLVDAISTAHPSLLKPEEVDALAVPCQILSPENDFMYTQELKDYTNSKIPQLGVDYDYQYFTGLSHGFAVRGDPSDPAQKMGVERAKNVVCSWFTEYLH